MVARVETEESSSGIDRVDGVQHESVLVMCHQKGGVVLGSDLGDLQMVVRVQVQQGVGVGGYL